MSFDTIILSAGRSSRMGQPKALLPYQGATVVEHIVQVLTQTASKRVVLVCGESNVEGTLCPTIAKRLCQSILKDIIITTGKSLGGPIDSIRCGLNALDNPGRLLLWPIDNLFATPVLIQKLATSFQAQDDKIARPVYGDKHGHPVLFGVQAQKELRLPGANTGAHNVVHKSPSRIIDVQWEDKRVTRNINTPQDAILSGISIA